MLNKSDISLNSGNKSNLNYALGDIKNIYNPTYHFTSTLKTDAIEKLIDLYNKEKSNPNYKNQTSFIKSLERFSVNTENDSIKSLQEKLEEGGFNDYIDYGLIVKEEYNKFLVENKFSMSIQKINAYLLSKIFDMFNTFVVPEIKQGTDHQIINEIIQNKIIEPIEMLVIGHDCDFEILSEHIRGMIYFLTGKCHINWK